MENNILIYNDKDTMPPCQHVLQPYPCTPPRSIVLHNVIHVVLYVRGDAN